LAGEKETFIAFGGNGDVQVAVPGEGNALTVFKGAQKPVKGEKECLLFYDQSTGEVRIEKLSSVMSVKKTSFTMNPRHFSILCPLNLASHLRRLFIYGRHFGSCSDSSLLSSSESDDSESEGLEKSRASLTQKISASRSSSSSDDDYNENDVRSSDSGDDDDLQEALEQQLRSESMPAIDGTTTVKQTKQYSQLLSNPKKLLHDDLQLSESSDED
uniref:Ell-associated factor Eaf n=1 Tax=Gongylonema pulchrum TaxID=637853 RepID=A0A183E4D0_9BILA